MRTAYRTLIWRLALLASAPGAGGCGPSAEGPAACAPYAGSSTEGFCRARAAGAAARPETVAAYCAATGEWAALCRQRFVQAQLREGGPPRAALLEWCGGAPDCALEVLDLRPAPGWPEQRALCAAWTGPFATDCLTHALGRWATGAPTAEGFAALVADPAPDPTLVGGWLGAAVACRGLGPCPASGPTAEACAAGERALRVDPTRCPQPIRGPAGAPSAKPTPPGSPTPG